MPAIDRNELVKNLELIFDRLQKLGCLPKATDKKMLITQVADGIMKNFKHMPSNVNEFKKFMGFALLTQALANQKLLHKDTIFLAQDYMKLLMTPKTQEKSEELDTVKKRLAGELIRLMPKAKGILNKEQEEHLKTFVNDFCRTDTKLTLDKKPLATDKKFMQALAIVTALSFEERILKETILNLIGADQYGKRLDAVIPTIVANATGVADQRAEFTADALSQDEQAYGKPQEQAQNNTVYANPTDTPAETQTQQNQHSHSPFGTGWPPRNEPTSHGQ